MKATSNQIAISAKKDFLERLSTTGPLNAVSEMIWNSFDAGSKRVDVNFTVNEIDGLEEIRIKDSGCGIPYDEVQELFGNLGESWKKGAGKKYGRSLHGKNGQGRFKAFALGNHVTWRTIFKSGDNYLSYQISGTSSALDSLKYTELKAAKVGTNGTEVIIDQIEKSHGQLLSEEAPQELAKTFAAYLSQYPGAEIVLNGKQVDPGMLQIDKKEILLDPIQLKSGESIQASVCIIEWQSATKRAIHLCDSNGIALHEVESGVHAPGFNFTAYIKSDHFRELDKNNYLILDDLHPDVLAIVSRGKDAIRTHFRKKAAEKHSQIVRQWKEEHIYPFEEKKSLTPVEEAERQVFDILAVNLESYLPSFEDADHKSRKFTFLLLSQALRDNPESVQKIITSVLNLKQDEQEELSRLLDSTTLSSIISSAKTVANRLDFLVALENLIFDKETKKKLLERDQLHKILENESWIFDEQFALSGSEERLEEVLQLNIGKLGVREDIDPVLREGGKQGRIDLIFSRTIQPRHDERDHLVVELKRPSQPINSEILTQVESYALAVAEDPRFPKTKTRWRFIVVSNDIDTHAKKKANQRDKAPGQVYDDADQNITVWAFQWTDIIANARARLQFINDSLSYEADRASSREYLSKAHAKFIPEIQADEPSEEEPALDSSVI